MSTVTALWTDIPDGAELHWMQIQGPIPMELWGKDHMSTLAYAETRAVDQGGKLDRRQMREGVQYPTRLVRGITVKGHTDYDCLADARALGLLEDTGDEDKVEFTDAGFAYVTELRKNKARTGRFNGRSD